MTKSMILLAATVAVLLAASAGFYARAARGDKVAALTGYTVAYSSAADRIVPVAPERKAAWFNLGDKLLVQPGLWRIGYRAEAYADKLEEGVTHPSGGRGDTGEITIATTLSTSPTGETDARTTSLTRIGWNLLKVEATQAGGRVYRVLKPTVFYLNVMARDFDLDGDQMHAGFVGSVTPTTITAERVG